MKIRKEALLTILLHAGSVWGNSCNQEGTMCGGDPYCCHVSVSCGACWSAYSCSVDMQLPGDHTAYHCLHGDCGSVNNNGRLSCAVGWYSLCAKNDSWALMCLPRSTPKPSPRPTPSPSQHPTLAPSKAPVKWYSTVTRSRGMNRTATSPIEQTLNFRCEDRPPLNHPDQNTCPVALDAIMTVVDTKLDHEINPTDFANYHQKANFSFGETSGDESIFWPNIKGKADMLSPKEAFTRTLGICGMDHRKLVHRVESSPGGALLNGIPICGYDRMTDCTLADSQASASFWQGAYSAYAAMSSETVHLVMTEDSNMDPFLAGAIPVLGASGVTTVKVYAEHCESEAVGTVIRTLSEEIVTVKTTCTDSIAKMVCQHAHLMEFCQCVAGAEAPQKEEHVEVSSLGLAATAADLTAFTGTISEPYGDYTIIIIIVAGFACAALAVYHVGSFFFKKKRAGYSPVPNNAEVSI